VLSSRSAMASSRRTVQGAKGELIRRLRIKRDLLQEDLANLAGISVEALSRIENGRSEPTRRTLAKLAPVLGVTPAYLDEKALGDVVVERATDPEARVFVERVLALHDAIALMSPKERERLYRLLETEATRSKKQ
jgi:transcriptional regulator with XRE-family HTH domain